MFGQSSTPFGSPQGGFGQSNSGGFGSSTPSTFGAPAPAPTGFGGFGSAPAPAPTGFGGFGQAPAPTAFGGGTGGFGAPSPAPAFGVSTGGFGAPQSSSLFGSAPAPAPTGLFGAATSAFGAPSTNAFGGGGVFGSSANTAPAFGSSTTTSAFGASPATGGGLFGSSSPAPAPLGFGSTTTGFGAPTTNVFGAPAPAPTGGLFGSAPSAPSGGLFGSTAPTGMSGAPGGTGGTKMTPFQPTNRPDGTSNITLLSISAMQAYENKSFEELRYEDYSQGNKGTGSQSGAVGGGFGAPSGFGAAPAPSLFGSAPAPAPFGAPAPATGGFGFGSPTPAPAPFGAPASTGAFGGTGGFGAPPAAPSLFGAPTPAPGLFGSAPAPAPTGGLFGSTSAPSTGFGAPPAPAFGAAPAPAPGLFGQSPSPAPSTGLFGSSVPSTSAFGSTGGAFGSAPLSGGFGTFGAPAPPPASGGLFGSTPAPGFGAPPAGGGLFGAPQPAPAGGGLFGAKPPGQSSLFGSQPAPAPGSFGMPPQSSFGGPSYGQYPQAPVMVAPPPVGSVMPPATNEIIASQFAAMESKQKEMEQADNFRRKPTESPTVTALSLSGRDSSAMLSPMRTLYNRTPLRSAAKARPRGFASDTDVAKAILGQQPLSKLGSGGKPMAAPETVAASSATRLIIAPSPKPKLRLTWGSTTNGDTSSSSNQQASPLKLSNGSSSSTTNTDSRLGSVQGKGAIEESYEQQVPTPRSQTTPSLQNGVSPLTQGGRAYDLYQRVIGAVDDDDDDPNVPVDGTNSSSIDKRGDKPILSKAGYSCSPSIATLARLESADLAAVSSFTVQRLGVGTIVWEGAVDVRGANLDRIVIIEPKSVSVYTEEEERGVKPPVGTKLNRPAIITLENVFPPEGSGPESSQKFVGRVAKQTKKMGAELINYDVSTGEWILRVHHFSKYGLDMDDDDDDDDDNDLEGDTYNNTPPLVGKEDVSHQDEKTVHWDFQSGGREGRSPGLHGVLKKQRMATPYKPSRAKLFVDLDESNININKTVDSSEFFLSDDVEMLDESQVMEDAKVAFNNMQRMLVTKSTIPSRKTNVMDDNSIFPDEGVTHRSDNVTKSMTRYVYDNSDLCACLSKPSITMKLARNTSALSSSKTDYGLRMGRSFRVAWGPNGTLLKPSKDGIVLIRARPKFSENSTHPHGDELLLLKTQQTHCERINVKKQSCPFFSLPTPTDPSGRKVLKNTLESYLKTVSTTAVTTRASVVKNAISLLLVLEDTMLAQGTNTGDDIFGGPKQPSNEHDLDSRILHAIGCWLSDSCSADVQREVGEGKSRNELYRALLSAVSGGNLELASSVADECGHTQLAIMITSGLDAKKDILEEVDSWRRNLQTSRLPKELYRSYSLIAGDESMEESLCKQMKGSYEFDWRRRMAMKLTYGTSPNVTNVLTLLEQYDVAVSKGVAPFPSPIYTSGSSTTSSVPSMLFSLLNLFTQSSGSELAETLNPLGYNQTPHDYSLAFHLASLITAMGCSKPLSPEDEYNLLDGFATQLLCRGYWYWSVYVTLYLFNSSQTGSANWRIKSAKTLVLRNYSSGDVVFRRFLEALSVPSQWFEEAMAYRCVMDGDTYGYLRHMIRVDTHKVAKTVEKIIIPNTLFLSGEKLSDTMTLLKALATTEDVPLARAVLDFFQIHRTIQELDGEPREDIEESIPALLEACDEVEQIFVIQQQGMDADIIEFIPDSVVVPMASFLAEGLSQISLFRLQVLALQSDMSVSSTASQMLKLATNQDIVSKSNFADRENVCRWLM